MKTYYYICILLIFSTHYLAQTLKSNFSRITQEDGLPSNEVSALLQDHLGYIWIGTNNGVSIYDGYDVQNFSVVNDDPNFLQHPLVSSLYEDSKNNIWIGSVGGITKYDRNKKSFKLYPFDDIQEMQERELVTLATCETSNGDLIIGVTDFYYRNIKSGLLTIKNGLDSLEVVQLTNNDTADVIFQISSIENDRFLISGFQGLGEYNHNDRSISWFPVRNNYPVSSFLQDTNKIVWLGTIWGEIYKYDLITKEYETVILPNPNKEERFFIINKIVFDQNKNLLLPTNKGLFQYNVTTKDIISVAYDSNHPTAINSVEIRDLIIDRTASMWLATRNGGVQKYNLVQSSFQSYKHNPNDPNSIEPGWVNTIFEFNQNEIWIKAEGNIFSRFNKADRSFKNDSIPSDSNIESIIKDNVGQIWMAGGYKLYKFDPKKWKLNDVNCPIENAPIHVLFEDRRKTFWIGTHFGLFTYDRENNLLAKIDFSKLGIGSPNSNSIYLIVEDSLNNIWFGSEDGLFNYNYQEKHYTRIGNSQDSSKALNSQNINALYVDNSGILWVGTWLGGLNRIDISTETIKSFSKEDGFKSHSVQGILGDEENGALWLSSFDGISRFDISEEKFQHFGISDGIQGSQFADRSALKTSQGEFLFGGQNGVTMFKPEDIKKDLIPPDVLITDFKLFNESVVPGENSVLSQPIYSTENIELDHDENDISIEFLAVHYVNPTRNKYAYILENYEDEWRFVGNQRTAVYPNLPPGDYTFKVKASNSNDVWNEEGKSVSIYIASPPWATWWAYSSYLILVLGILYSIRKFELRRQKKNAEIKESKLRAESAELQAKAAEAQALVIQAENDRKSKELEEARQLQLSMLPKELPKLPHLDIAVYMKTATEVGGDYYDFHIGLDGTLTAVIGDATGHGMKAGTIVSTTKGLFNVLAPNPNIKETFHEMARCLKLMQLEKLSMCMTMLKISGDKLSMSAAGMPPVYIYRNDKNSVEEHVFKGMPLGTMENFPYSIESTELLKGDTILMMSDGFPELMNEEKEMYGFKRTRNLFEDFADKTPEEIIKEFKNTGSDWVKEKDPDDDVTFVVLKVK